MAGRNRPAPIQRKNTIQKAVIPENIIGDLRDSFDHFDPEKTGYIGLHHLKAILQNFTMKTASRKEIEDEIFRVVEKDQAEWNDLLAIVSRKYSRGGAEEEIRDLFKIFDKRERGHSTPHEIKSKLTQHLAVPASAAELDSLIAEINIDSTGNITFHDFKTLMESF